MPKLKKSQKILLIAAAAALLCALCGCAVSNVEELYALPRHSDEDNELQKAIDSVMTEGVQYAAPVSGKNQQSVQLADLDADGEDEAIVFLRVPGDKPLRACVFDLADGAYRSLGFIDGSGAAFERAEYVQLDGEPGVEIVLGRRVGNQVLRAMSVYTLREGQLVELMSTNYSEYALTDLDLDGNREIFLLRFDPEAKTGTAGLYRWNGSALSLENEAALSAGAQSVRRMVTGQIAYDVPAVVVTSDYHGGEGIVTDVFAIRGGALENISSGVSGLNVQAAQDSAVYPADPDGDGLLEIPQVAWLVTDDESTDSGAMIFWYNLTLGGSLTIKMTTYHNFSGGWFLRLPDSWGSTLNVTRGEQTNGVRGFIFSAGGEPVVTIYAFTGDERNQLASSDGRFIVAEKGGVTYAAQPGSAPLAAELTQEALKKMFNFIHIDWNSGER